MSSLEFFRPDSQLALFSPSLKLGMELQAGNVSNMSAAQIFGYNANLQASETLWDYGGTKTWFTAAKTLGISSGSANDAAAGTGAITIIITGVNAAYALVTETITMNGQAKVETVNQYLNLHEMYVATFGATGNNVGIIYAYDTSDAIVAGVPQTATKVAGTIAAVKGRSRLGVYTVPAGKTAYMISRTPYFLLQTLQFGTLTLRIRPFGLSWWEFLYGYGVTINDGSDLQIPPIIPEKSDIEFLAQTSVASAVTIESGLILIDD